MYVQIVERNPGTLTELNLLSGTPPVPQHYLWSVNIISETVVTIKKRTIREQQETLLTKSVIYNCKIQLINAIIISHVQSIEKFGGHIQSESDAKVKTKMRMQRSYSVEIFRIVANQMIPVEIYKNFQRLGIFDISWNTCPNFRPIIFQKGCFFC